MPRASEPAPPPTRIAIVVAEGDARGIRLVAIDEHGDRQLELLKPADGIARDVNPAVSPDGKWLAFASSRGRELGETSLWIAPLEPEATPIQLTRGSAIDAQPAWDRGALVWASTRGGHGFDLWRAPVGSNGALGSAEQLTHGDGHEITPSVAADGAIVYGAVDALGGAARIEERARDCSVRAITSGNADSAPAVSPDGTRVAFARPVARLGFPDGGGLHRAGSAAEGQRGLIDSDLWITSRAGSGEASVLVDLPLTDESGPVWSRDGRYLFATSVLRGADGRAVFSSVIVVDTQESPPIARLLEDRAGAIARLTPAIAAQPLDGAALHANREYLPELARQMATPILNAKQPPPSPDTPAR